MQALFAQVQVQQVQQVEPPASFAVVPLLSAPAARLFLPRKGFLPRQGPSILLPHAIAPTREPTP
jgi:hypothetical protein